MFESLDRAKLIQRYDTPDTLFYLDLPNWGGETDYGRAVFSRDGFTRMAEVLADLKGRFILSINDRPEVREVFGQFHFDEVCLTYTIAKGEGTEARELIITDREAVTGLL